MNRDPPLARCLGAAVAVAIAVSVLALGEQLVDADAATAAGSAVGAVRVQHVVHGRGGRALVLGFGGAGGMVLGGRGQAAVASAHLKPQLADQRSRGKLVLLVIGVDPQAHDLGAHRLAVLHRDHRAAGLLVVRAAAAVFVVAVHLEDQQTVQQLVLRHLVQVEGQVRQALAVEDEEHAVAGRVAAVTAAAASAGEVRGRLVLGAHEQRALEAALVPLDVGLVEDVDGGVGGDGQDAADAGAVAAQDGQVELRVGARGEGGHQPARVRGQVVDHVVAVVLRVEEQRRRRQVHGGVLYAQLLRAGARVQGHVGLRLGLVVLLLHECARRLRRGALGELALMAAGLAGSGDLRHGRSQSTIDRCACWL